MFVLITQFIVKLCVAILLTQNLHSILGKTLNLYFQKIFLYDNPSWSKILYR